MTRIIIYHLIYFVSLVILTYPILYYVITRLERKSSYCTQAFITSQNSTYSIVIHRNPFFNFHRVIINIAIEVLFIFDINTKQELISYYLKERGDLILVELQFSSMYRYYLIDKSRITQRQLNSENPNDYEIIKYLNSNQSIH